MFIKCFDFKNKTEKNIERLKKKIEYVPTLINEEWIILDSLKDKTRNIKILCVVFVFNITHKEIHTENKIIVIKNGECNWIICDNSATQDMGSSAKAISVKLSIDR